MLRHALPAAVAALALAAPAAGAQVPQCAVLGTPCKLSLGLNEAQVISPKVAPDGTRVVFSHKTISGPLELFAAPIHGGVLPTRLSPAGEETEFRAISPDSRRVLYTAQSRLYSVPTTGPASARVRLTDDVGTAPQILVSPDSLKVVVVPPARDRLRVVPITGPASAGQRLSDPFVPGATAGSVRISDDSRSVVYRSDQEAVGVFGVYRVPLALSPAPDPPTTRLNGPLVEGGDVSEFMIIGATVIYRADQDTDSVRELFRVRLGGGDRAKLSGPMAPGWEVSMPSDSDDPARITPDGTRVLYETFQSAGGWMFRQLYSVPLAGPATASVRIDDPSELPPGKSAVIDYKLTDDRVVYTMANQATGRQQTTAWLLTAPVTGPAEDSTLLTFPLSDGFVYEIGRDGRRVVFLLGTAVYSVPIDGIAHTRLNGDEDPSGFLRAGAGRIVYSANVGIRAALFSAALDGNGARRDLTASLGANVSALGRALTPDGNTVVYIALRGVSVDLYSSGLAPLVVPPQP